jgi:hypothetical protein
MIHVCCFSGAAGELTGRQKRNPMLVLQALSNDPRVSTWDMETLWKTIDTLKENGWIAQIVEPYPWHRFVITEDGKNKLEAASKGEGVKI